MLTMRSNVSKSSIGLLCPLGRILIRLIFVIKFPVHESQLLNEDSKQMTSFTCWATGSSLTAVALHLPFFWLGQEVKVEVDDGGRRHINSRQSCFKVLNRKQPRIFLLRLKPTNEKVLKLLFSVNDILTFIHGGKQFIIVFFPFQTLTNPIPDPRVYLDFHPLKKGQDLTEQKKKLRIKTEQVVMMETTKKTMMKMTRNTIRFHLPLIGSHLRKCCLGEHPKNEPDSQAISTLKQTSVRANSLCVLYSQNLPFK